MSFTMASWLVRSTPDRAVRARALAGDTVLCSWTRHCTLTMPLCTQVYKWVLVNFMLKVTLRWTSIPSSDGAEIFLVASCYRSRDYLRPDGPLGTYLYLLFTEDTWRNEDSWSKGFASEDPSRFQFTGYLSKHSLSYLLPLQCCCIVWIVGAIENIWAKYFSSSDFPSWRL